MRKSNAALAFLLVICVSNVAFSQNIGGTPISGTPIGLEHDPAGIAISPVTTDAIGKFSFPRLNKGKYKLTLSYANIVKTTASKDKSYASNPEGYEISVLVTGVLSNGKTFDRTGNAVKVPAIAIINKETNVVSVTIPADGGTLNGILTYVKTGSNPPTPKAAISTTRSNIKRPGISANKDSSAQKTAINTSRSNIKRPSITTANTSSEPNAVVSTSRSNIKRRGISTGTDSSAQKAFISTTRSNIKRPSKIGTTGTPNADPQYQEIPIPGIDIIVQKKPGGTAVRVTTDNAGKLRSFPFEKGDFSLQIPGLKTVSAIASIVVTPGAGAKPYTIKLSGTAARFKQGVSFVMPHTGTASVSISDPGPKARIEDVKVTVSDPAVKISVNEPGVK